VKLSTLSTENAAFKQIKKVATEVLQTFIECKDAMHDKGDLPFTDSVSSLMDLRNWDGGSLKQKSSEETAEFEKRIENLKKQTRKICDEGCAFWNDFGAEEVKMEFEILIDHLVKENNLTELQEMRHIADQWGSLMVPTLRSVCSSLLLIAKRASMCGNAASSCERENSKIARYKDKLSSTMGINMMRARSRVGSNGPHLHRFDAKESVRFWIEQGHKHAQTKMDIKSKVIKRMKKEKDTKYTSKIFTQPFYANSEL